MPHHRPLAGIGLDEPVRLDLPAVEEHHIEEFLSSQVPTPHRQLFDSTGFARFGFHLCAGARCRVDLIMTVGGPALVMHFLPDPLPGPEELNTSEEVLDLVANGPGLFLICGKPRSGKTTTLASVLQYMNATSFRYIAWLCGAAEYLLAPGRAFVNQVETGHLMYGSGPVETAVWMGADVVALDLQVDDKLAWQAVLAAERGARVFMVLPACDTANGLQNLANTVNSDLRREFIARLSEVFGGALYQELVRGIKAPVAVMEILVGTDPVRNLLKEGKFAQLPDLIHAGGKYGMQTLEAARKRLSDEGLI
jgi:twitching motility protein PilT